MLQCRQTGKAEPRGSAPGASSHDPGRVPRRRSAPRRRPAVLAGLAAAAWALLMAAGLGPAPASASDPTGGRGQDAPPGVFDNPARAAFRHHSLAARLRPERAGLQVTDRVRLCHPAGVPAELETPFLLHRDLTIEGISAHSGGARVALQWREYERWEPRAFWEQPAYPDLAELTYARQVDLALRDRAVWPETLQVTITYAGTLYDSLKPPPESYQRGFETTHGLIDPRGVFLSGGSLWYPQRFDEPFTFDLSVHLPTDWRAVSQGRLTAPHPPATAPPPAGHLDAWSCAAPMEEIYLIAGPYVLRQEDHHGVAVQTFTYGRDDEELTARYREATRAYLDLYGERIGPYPFPKFALVENFWQTGYGMPSFTLLGDRVIRLPFIIHTSYGHEILHNWWGNGVFVDYASGNWCEGLTVYGADYLYKEREGEAAGRDYRRTQLQSYRDYVRSGRDFPLTEFRERHDASSAAIGYGKAMMLYHMLRRRLGDEAFWATLADFYARFRFRNATWHDLLGVFADHGGPDPEHFYAQWVARPGAPALRLARADLTYGEDASTTLAYRLEQDQPRYDLVVPLRLTYPDRAPESWLVTLEGGVFEDTRTLPARPQGFAVDPDFDLFRQLHLGEAPVSISRLMGADSVTTVIAAAQGPVLRAALRATGENYRRAKPNRLASDQELLLADLGGASVWLFGAPRWWERLATVLPPELEISAARVTLGGESYDRATHTFILALPHPDASREAVGALLTEDAGSVAGIWRKLPHYGKYSYLVFEGTRNVAKGSWEVVRSPLKVAWEEGDR